MGLGCVRDGPVETCHRSPRSSFDENSSGRQCRLAAAAIDGSLSPGSLLSADPDRVAVLEVVAHVTSERDVDRVRVLRISRRSVADVDRRYVDDPSSNSFEVRGVTATNEPRAVGGHRVRAVYEPAVKRSALCPEEVIEIDIPELGSPEKRPVTGYVTGELGNRTAETRNDLTVVADGIG